MKLEVTSQCAKCLATASNDDLKCRLCGHGEFYISEDFWPDRKEDLSKEEAEFIRHEKTSKLCTWRRLSEIFCEKYLPNSIFKGNQLHGIDLCKYAAEHFGEDYYEEPWN